MTELEMQQQISEALLFEDEENENDEIFNILSFEEAGILTNNKGIVVKMRDMSEFQVTIVKIR